MADVNFDQIMENPSIEAIQELLGDPVPEVSEPEESVEAAGEPDSTKTKEEETVEQVDEEEEPIGIATKSGKGIIPYAELATERERRRAAELAAQQMQQRLADMEAQLNSRSADKGAPEEVDATDDDLAAMFEDFPQLAKPFKAMQAKISQYEDRINQIQQVENQRAATEQADVAKSVQEAMDENPKLLYLQAEDADLFNAAVKIDDQLKTDPRFSHLSLSERFAKAVAGVEALYGEIELPAKYQTSKAPSVSEQEIVEKAKAAAAKASQSARPRTLSDIPGGVAPQSDDAKIENMSAGELAEMFSKKSPDEIAAFVARFG